MTVVQEASQLIDLVNATFVYWKQVVQGIVGYVVQ